MTNPKPTSRATIEQQFSDVDASFRLEGFERSAYSEGITAAIAGGVLTHEEAIAKIIADADPTTPRGESSK